jgi:hypothetical protein
MAMSTKAWMTASLFSTWIDHFILALENHNNVSLTSHHLLIMDGHNSHVTIEVMHRAHAEGLHLLTLPSHCSHAMQPLDVAVFKPFKGAFCVYCDAWTTQNRGSGAWKEVLASWTSKALKRALTVENIQAGFHKMGIYPLNPSELDSSMGPSSAFGEVEGECNNNPSEETSQFLQEFYIQEVLEEAKELPNTRQHYMVNLGDEEGDEELEFPPSQGSKVSLEQLGISGMLTLPTVPVTHSRVSTGEPLVDYSKSILLTSDDYLRQVESLAAKRSNANKAKEAEKVATEQRKRKREEERIVQFQRKKECKEAKADKAREKAYWADDASCSWRNELQARLKSNLPPPPDSYIGVYVGTVPA